MNALVLVCLLSVSQKSIHGGGGCAGDVCRVRAAKPAAVAPVQAPVDYLGYLAALRMKLVDKGRTIYDADPESRDGIRQECSDIRREIDRVQGLLVHQHRVEWAHSSPKFIPVSPGVVGYMQAYAVRAAVAGVGR